MTMRCDRGNVVEALCPTGRGISCLDRLPLGMNSNRPLAAFTWPRGKVPVQRLRAGGFPPWKTILHVPPHGPSERLQASAIELKS
jgi:hypothetical protein